MLSAIAESGAMKKPAELSTTVEPSSASSTAAGSMRASSPSGRSSDHAPGRPEALTAGLKERMRYCSLYLTAAAPNTDGYSRARACRSAIVNALAANGRRPSCFQAVRPNAETKDASSASEHQSRSHGRVESAAGEAAASARS